jgi:hypothetical protein
MSPHFSSSPFSSAIWSGRSEANFLQVCVPHLRLRLSPSASRAIAEGIRRVACHPFTRHALFERQIFYLSRRKALILWVFLYERFLLLPTTRHGAQPLHGLVQFGWRVQSEESNSVLLLNELRLVETREDICESLCTRLLTDLEPVRIYKRVMDTYCPHIHCVGDDL